MPRLFQCFASCALSLVLATTIFADTRRMRVGVVSAVSGPISGPGTSIQNAFRLADERDDPTDAVEFIFEDDQGSARNTVTAVKKLLDYSSIEGLVTFMAPTSISVADIAEQKRLPMIGITMTDKILQGRKYVYKHYASMDGLAQSATDELQKLGVGTLAIVSTVHEGLSSLKAIFRKIAKQQIVLDEEMLPEELELRSVAMRVIKAAPGAVWINMNPPQLSILAKSLREQNYRGVLFGSPPMANRNEIAAAHGALDDGWFVTSDVGRAEEFVEAYVNRFGSNPEPEGFQAYDIARILIAAGGDHQSLSQYLSGLHAVEGILGKYSVEGNRFRLNPKVFYVREFVKLDDG